MRHAQRAPRLCLVVQARETSGRWPMIKPDTSSRTAAAPIAVERRHGHDEKPMKRLASTLAVRGKRIISEEAP